MNALEQLSGAAAPPRPTIRGLKDGETVDVIPYSGYTKESDFFLPWAWRKFKEDGLIELYFPGMSETGFPAFVSLMSSTSVGVVLVVVRDSNNEVIDLLGLATSEMLSFGQLVMGHCGFIFLSKYWEAKSSTQAAKRIMHYWFETLNLDVLVGMIAVDNHLAMRFIQRVGWTRKGTITGAHQYHGKPCDAALWEITKQQFEAMEAK